MMERRGTANVVFGSAKSFEKEPGGPKPISPSRKRQNASFHQHQTRHSTLDTEIRELKTESLSLFPQFTDLLNFQTKG
jgi:hypothetical protein